VRGLPKPRVCWGEVGDVKEAGKIEMFQVGAENCVLRIARGTELQIVGSDYNMRSKARTDAENKQRFMNALKYEIM